jgi:hypothetical protein
MLSQTAVGWGRRQSRWPRTADGFALLSIEFDVDQCANCDGVVGIMSRAFVTEDAVFSFSLTRPPKVGGLFLCKKLQNVTTITQRSLVSASICSYVPVNGHLNARARDKTRIGFPEMALNNKLMFVALGYLLLLAALGFALDLSIAAMIVS